MTLAPTIVTSQLPPDLGGTSTYAHEIARGLRDAGERPLVVIRDRDPREFDPLGLTVRSVDTRRGWLKPLRLRRARREVLDLARAHGSRVVLFAYPVSGLGDVYGALARAGIPYVVSVHGIRRSDLATHGSRARARRKWGLDQAARILANASWMADQIAALGVPRDRVVPVYLGVDPAIADAPAARTDELRASLGLAGKRVLVSVGRLTPQKNHDAILRALARVDAHLVVVGAGDSRGALESLAASLGVTSRVRFVGGVARGDVGAYYRLGDVHVLVPRAKAEDDSLESFGLVYLEAALCEVPSIGARTTGIPEAIGDAGVLVDPDSDEALVAAIERLLRDDAERRRLGAAARARALERFSWARCVRETLAVLERAAS